MTYSIIIPTKDRLESLKKLITTIRVGTTDYEIIVIDDCSKDGTFLWAEDQDILYVRTNKSIPVAQAWNMGAQLASGKYLVFLNDDMEVSNGWLDKQKDFYEKNQGVGCLAFKVLDDQGQIQSRGHCFNKLTPYLPPEDNRVIDYSPNPFVKKSLWEQVGGFSAHGHMYYEDTDFGLKLQSMGRTNYYNPDAVIIHTTMGCRIGDELQKERRSFNENIRQKESAKSFYKTWTNYLMSK